MNKREARRLLAERFGPLATVERELKARVPRPLALPQPTVEESAETCAQRRNVLMQMDTEENE